MNEKDSRREIDTQAYLQIEDRLWHMETVTARNVQLLGDGQTQT